MGGADIDLAAGDIVAAPGKREGLGQPGDRVLGRRARHGVGPWGVVGMDNALFRTALKSSAEQHNSDQSV